MSSNITKELKAAYARYGIETKGNKIVSPIGLISPVLKDGNTKTGKGVKTFSLLAGMREYYSHVYGKVCGTCGYNCPGCYAMTGKYNCDNVIDSNAVNTLLAREFPEFLENAIRAQLETLPGVDIRIHAAGDFFSQEYAAMWARIVRDFPNNNFWTYTKTEYENTFDGLPNGNIVKSVLPVGGFNFGHIDYVLKMYAELVAAGETPYICRCTLDKDQHCENCKGCIDNNYVLFIEHATKYNAAKDPLFAAALDIVDRQKTETPETIAARVVKILTNAARAIAKAA